MRTHTRERSVASPSLITTSAGCTAVSSTSASMAHLIRERSMRPAHHEDLPADHAIVAPTASGARLAGRPPCATADPSRSGEIRHDQANGILQATENATLRGHGADGSRRHSPQPRSANSRHGRPRRTNAPAPRNLGGAAAVSNTRRSQVRLNRASRLSSRSRCRRDNLCTLSWNPSP